jgi:hypothetical protein
MRFTFGIAIFLLAYFTADQGAVLGEESEFLSRDDGQVVEISEDGMPVLVYQLQEKSLDGQWSRAGYVHPLYDLGGNVFTEDFPDDHKHHRGIFWAWHHLSVGDLVLGDPWLCKEFVRQCIETTMGGIEVGGEDCMRIDLVTLWKSPRLKDPMGDMLPVVKERTRIIVHPRTTQQRLMDFDISLTAMLSDVRIGGSDDVKGYGGFSPRIKLNSKEVFRFLGGEVQPQKLAVQGGPWVDISNENRGLTIMSHPENPVATQESTKSDSGSNQTQASNEADQQSPRWILRRKRSMQNVAYPGRKPVLLSTDTATRLRYRLVVHDGKLTPKSLQAIYDRFANGK